ncbi:MAG: response regulator [Methylibium sp.]|uniref:hybrid sensor histidine kinase/response regulator n=1 Tax=Methylibium sp. TaxID=2067992 RepID=UPI0017C6B61A|nr:ATP-binding protein [Methylibium sp.]MBA3596636.1 response regulator [Methylibium sp.]
MSDKLTLRRKLMLVVMLTTGLALLLSALALLTYDLRAYRSASVDDLQTQAELMASSSASALAFDDPKVARENLATLQQRPQIRSAAFYSPEGKLFVTYRSPAQGSAPVPAKPQPTGYRFDGDDLEVFQTIDVNGQMAGTVYLRARYDYGDRLRDYALILALIMLGSLGLSALIFQRLQRAVTEPIEQVANVAREVVDRRNYGLRVPKTSSDEIGVLVDAFNAMLAEVGRRTDALERANADLSIEMRERQKVEDALRTADRRKDEFLATLAHELRNPLAPLANGLEILKRGDADATMRQRARVIMERQLKQMVRLIDDLLELSRMSTGKLELRRASLDLVAVLRSAVEHTEPQMRAHGQTLATHLPREPVWLDADAMRLAQVFVNLLTNAAKYTDPDGHITVELAIENGNAVVHVTDNGIGIEPAMQEKIFEMFTQVDQSLERGRAGLGVGLTLARQLVELHGGRLSVASAGLGQGSRFSVSLRLAEHPPAAVPQPDASMPPPPHARRAGDGADEADRLPLQVLVADDNADFASSLSSMLQAQGHQVQVVFDGLTAFEAATARRPDVGFFDIGMPGLNGYELAQRLRMQPRMQGVMLVAITGWGQDSDRLRSRQAGFDHHLVKPVDLDQVLHLLQERARS